MDTGKLNTDPAIDEIREIRRQISTEFGHDPRRLLMHYREYEKQLEREGKYRLAELPDAEKETAALNDKPRKK